MSFVLDVADDAADETTLQTVSGSSKQTIRTGLKQKSSSLMTKEKKKGVSSKTLAAKRKSVIPWINKKQRI